MIRAVGEFHSLSPAQQEQPRLNPTPLQRSASLGASLLSKRQGLVRSSTTHGSQGLGRLTRSQSPKPVISPADDELNNVKDALNTVDEYHATVVETLEVNIIPVLVELIGGGSESLDARRTLYVEYFNL